MKKNIQKTKKPKHRKKWYDKECRIFKNTVRVSATIKNKNPWDINIRNEYKNLLKSYKKLCSKKQREFWVKKTKN